MRWLDERERDLALAWHNVAFLAEAKAGKLPDLEVILARARGGPIRKRTAKARRAEVAMLGEHLGIAARPISAAAKRALARLKEQRG